MAAPVVGAQDTQDVPLLTGAYRTEAVFAKYPRLTNDNIWKGMQARAFDMYVLRGDALVNYNAQVAEGESLPDLADDPKRHPGRTYRIKTVDPLFAHGSILYSGSQNFAALDAAAAATANTPYRAKGGEPVDLDFRFGSTSGRIRLGYFYVTPGVATELSRRVAASWEDTRDKSESDITAPFDLFVYKARRGELDPKRAMALIDDYTLGLYAAFHAKLIPAFSVASDLVNRDYITVKAPDGEPDMNVSYISGSNNLGNVWGSYEKYMSVANAEVTGSIFRLSYFGDDYLGEASYDFPEDTYIYPFIISDKNDRGEIRVDGDGYATLTNDMQTPRMMVSSLNFYNPYGGGSFDETDESDEIRGKYVGQPNAFSFPYTYVAYDGSVRNLNLTAFEDQALPASSGGNYADIVLDVQGVKPIAEESYSTNHITIGVSPVGQSAGGTNKYSHWLSLNAPAGEGLKSRRLGLLEVVRTEGGVYTSYPLYSVINILRSDCGAAPVAHVILRESFTDESLGQLGSGSADFSRLQARIDYHVCTAAEYAGISGADGVDYDAVGDWTQLQEPYLFFDDDGSFQRSVEVDLDAVEGLRDVFERDATTAPEEYEYSAYLVGYSGYVMHSANKDRVVIPKSEVLVERGGDLEFVPGVNCAELPEETAGAGLQYVSVKVAKAPLMYGKERVVSYTVLDSSGDEVCTLHGATDGSWAATGGATVLGYNPCGDDDEYGWVVLLIDSDGATSDSYSVNINTEPLDSTAPDIAACNSYGTPPAEAIGADDLLAFEVTAKPKAYASCGWLIMHGVTSGWTLHDSIDPEGVLFNEWRTYDRMYGVDAVGCYGNILSGRDAGTGYMSPDSYGAGLSLHFPLLDANELICDGNTFTNLDILTQTFGEDDDAVVDATYVLRAYIPDYRPRYLPDPARRNAPAADTPVRYTMLEKTAVLRHTAEERDDSLTGIAGVAVGSVAPVEYYNLQGVRLSTPRPGQAVIRRRGATAEKVIFR